VTTLKSTVLQLLLDKMPSFHQGVSGPVLKQLIDTFHPLLQQALDILKEEAESVSAKNSEKQSFVQGLFALLSRTASQQLHTQVQKSSLKLTL